MQSASSLPTTLSSPASPSASWKVTLCRLTPCAKKRSALTSYLTRGAVCDVFTTLAHTNWHRGCAGRAARHLASRPEPSEAGNALVLADTRERSKTVARSKLAASSATHDASLANSRVRAIRRVELFGLGDGAVRTLQQGCRDATGKLQTRIGVSVAVEVAYLNGQCCCTQLGLVALCAIASAFFLAKRDRRNRDLHLLVGRRQDCTLMSTSEVC